MKKNNIHILVTGAKGQVGSELQLLALKFPAWKFSFIDVGGT